MVFDGRVSYAPAKMDQIMIGDDDDDDVEGLASETEFADAIIIARNTARRRQLILKSILAVLGGCALIGVGVGLGMAAVSKRANNGGGGGSSSAAGASQSSNSLTNDNDGGDGQRQPPDPPVRAFLTPPPEDLSDICSPTTVSTQQGFAKCQDTCAEAACCNLPGDKLSCLDNNEKNCATYDAFCEVLTFDHNGDGKVEAQEHVTIPKPPSNILSICEWDSLLNIDGYNECKAACEPGKCCYESIETCRVNNGEMCEFYDQCEILHVQEVISVPAGDSKVIGEACAPDSLAKTAGYMSCKNVCAPASCCFEPIETCKVENPAMCKEYDACSVLSESATPQSHPDAVESKVKKFCTTSNLKHTSGVKECKEACNPGLCCVGGLDGKADKCSFPEYEEWCSQYDACQLLQHIDDEHGFDGSSDAKKAIDKECSDFSVEGVANCQKVCNPAECCFKVDEDCSESGMDDIHCSHYKPCGHLYLNDQDPTTTSIPNNEKDDSYDENNLMQEAEAIVQMCVPERLEDPNGLEDCKDICEDMLCCFADEEYNCIKSYKETCIVYAGCEPLTDYLNR